MQRALLILTALLLLSAPCAAADKRAFVLGINDYENVSKLKNAVADAATMADMLTNLGYKTTLIGEGRANRSAILIEFGKFVSSLKPGDDAVIFYSGHGVEVQGANHLVPKDAPKPEDIGNDTNLGDQLISFGSLIAQVKNKDVAGNIWIIDACRNNPFQQAGRQFGSSAGLGNMNSPVGTFVFFSASAGTIALDSLPNDPPTEKNGVYTRAFSKLVQQRKSDDVRFVAQEARKLVRELTANKQHTAYYDELDTPWCFDACRTLVAINLQTVSATIPNPTVGQLRAATNTTTTGFAPGNDKAPNAVFLGRKSTVANCTERNPDQRPFGCAVLAAAAGTSEQRNTLFQAPLKAITAVRVRLRAPTVQEKETSVYSCPVRTVNEGETVSIGAVVDVIAGGDTFYWGAVKGRRQDCSDTNPG